jgi:hypothetical protein
MASMLRCQAPWRRFFRSRFFGSRFFGRRIAGNLAIVILLGLCPAGTLRAQEAGVHYLHHGVMPPGAIGSRQLQRGGPLPGFFQPVEVKAPPGALISLAIGQQFDAGQAAPCRAGLLIGSVYRLRVTHIPRAEGLEVFPTIEVIDRLYAPLGQEARFAIPVELTQAELEMSLAGRFVTRVIYLEDPQKALPVASGGGAQSWFDAGPNRDPLAVADGLGRPVAILRMGGRLPDARHDPGFFFGSPPWLPLAPRPVAVKAAPAAPTAQPPTEPIPPGPVEKMPP